VTWLGWYSWYSRSLKPTMLHTIHAVATWSDAPSDDLLDEQNEPVKKLPPDRSALICCSTTTVFGFHVVNGWRVCCWRNPNSMGIWLMRVAITSYYYLIAANINYVDSLMITGLLSKLERSDTVMASWHYNFLINVVERVNSFSLSLLLISSLSIFLHKISRKAPYYRLWTRKLPPILCKDFK
jgi:hypothetical protein